MQAGLVDALDDVLTTYTPCPAGDIARVFGEMPPRDIQRETGYSRTQVNAIRNGTSKPKPERLPVALAYAARFARDRLAEMAVDPSPDDAETVRLYATLLRQHDGHDAMVRKRRRAVCEANRALRAAILALGGIGPHRDGSLHAEYHRLPRRQRAPAGPPPDDIAASLADMYPEFGIHDEHDLYARLT